MANQNNEEKTKRGLIAGIIGASIGGATLIASIPVIILNSGKTTPINYYTVTFDVNSTQAKLSGEENVKMAEETTFGKINKPGFSVVPSGMVFNCWTTDKEGNNPVGDETKLSKNTTVYAKWLPETSVYTLTFSTNSEQGVTIKGEKAVSIKAGQKFKDINKPEATKVTSEVGKSYVFDYWTTVPGSITGKINDDKTFDRSTTIYPVFKEYTEEQHVHLTFMPKKEDEGYDVTFNGMSSLRISLSNQITFGECNKPEVSKTKTVAGWTLIYPFLNKWVYKDASGNYQEVPSNTKFTDAESYVYPVFSDEPTFLESQYYVKMDGQLGAIVNNTESIGDQIEIQFAEGDNKFINKSEFNERIYIGSKITSISPNFLRGCTKYNQKIELPNNVTFIGSGFLFGATSFNNGGEELVIPQTVTSIGNCFLYGCTSFNQNINFNEGLELIGDYFMFYCTAYNKKLVLPTTLVEIGNSFLANCINYNNNSSSFTLPNKLKNLGSGFLEECSKFTQDIDLSNTEITIINDSFLYNASNYTGQVKLPSGLTSIGNNFMAWIENTSFKQVDFTVCTQLKSIGDAFFNNSKYYQQAIDLSKTQVESIGKNMLRTTNYNSAITFPSTLESLGEYFMYQAYSFNTSLTLPSSLKTIGDGFMYNCTRYTTATLTISCSLDAWDTTTVDTSFYRSASASYKVSYAGGIAAVQAKFPNKLSGYYRNFTAA